MGTIFRILLVSPTDEYQRTITDARGKTIGIWKYRSPYSIETKTMFSIDDAVSFLFDCDIHLWNLESYTVDKPQFGFHYWNITLKREIL